MRNRKEVDSQGRIGEEELGELRGENILYEN